MKKHCASCGRRSCRRFASTAAPRRAGATSVRCHTPYHFLSVLFFNTLCGAFEADSVPVDQIARKIALSGRDSRISARFLSIFYIIAPRKNNRAQKAEPRPKSDKPFGEAKGVTGTTAPPCLRKSS